MNLDDPVAVAHEEHNTSSQQPAEMAAEVVKLQDSPIGVDHVNWLLKACGISQERTIETLKQCSSSLFALLFQRIFNCTISDLELEPNTQEKRLWNIQRVLTELQLFVSTDLSYISAEHIVALDEEHISELIRVFFEIVIGFVMGSHNARSNGIGSSASLAADEEVSQADSAQKTHRLVSNWKREVVHPLRDVDTTGRGGNALVSKAKVAPLADSIAELHNRMHHLDRLLVTPRKDSGTGGKKKKRVRLLTPSQQELVLTHRSHPGSLFPPSTYSLAKTIDTEARDIKIQQLKTMRFLSNVQQAMRSDIIKSASIEQAEIARTIAPQQKKIRADTRDLLKYCRDENERYKAAYEVVLMSARNDVARFRDMIDPKTVQIYDRNAKATKTAKEGVKASIAQQKAKEDRKVGRYYDAVTAWRRGTVASV